MMTKYSFRESKQRQREQKQPCRWYIKSARDYCHSPAIRGAKFCKTHSRYMRSWIGKKHRESYSKQNVVDWGGFSKFDE